jgi:hypothetical protein
MLIAAAGTSLRGDLVGDPVHRDLRPVVASQVFVNEPAGTRAFWPGSLLCSASAAGWCQQAGRLVDAAEELSDEWCAVRSTSI